MHQARKTRILYGHASKHLGSFPKQDQSEKISRSSTRFEEICDVNAFFFGPATCFHHAGQVSLPHFWSTNKRFGRHNNTHDQSKLHWCRQKVHKTANYALKYYFTECILIHLHCTSQKKSLQSCKSFVSFQKCCSKALADTKIHSESETKELIDSLLKRDPNMLEGIQK